MFGNLFCYEWGHFLICTENDVWLYGCHVCSSCEKNKINSENCVSFTICAYFAVLTLFNGLFGWICFSHLWHTRHVGSVWDAVQRCNILKILVYFRYLHSDLSCYWGILCWWSQTSSTGLPAWCMSATFNPPPRLSNTSLNTTAL